MKKCCCFASLMELCVRASVEGLPRSCLVCFSTLGVRSLLPLHTRVELHTIFPDALDIVKAGQVERLVAPECGLLSLILFSPK